MLGQLDSIIEGFSNLSHLMVFPTGSACLLAAPRSSTTWDTSSCRGSLRSTTRWAAVQGLQGRECSAGPAHLGTGAPLTTPLYQGAHGALGKGFPLPQHSFFGGFGSRKWPQRAVGSLMAYQGRGVVVTTLGQRAVWTLRDWVCVGIKMAWPLWCLAAAGREAGNRAERQAGKWAQLLASSHGPNISICQPGGGLPGWREGEKATHLCQTEALGEWEKGMHWICVHLLGLAI